MKKFTIKKAIATVLTCALCASLIFQPVLATNSAKTTKKSTVPVLTAEQTQERAYLSTITKYQADVAAWEQEMHTFEGKTPIVKLDVTNILQYPELPNGCEATALATIMLYNGLYVDKALLNSYLPSVPFTILDGYRASGNPEEVYCGDPTKSSEAFYCFEDPLIEAGNRMIKEFNMNINLKKLDKAKEQELIAQLDMGNPVVVWTTLSNGDPVTFNPYGWVDVNNTDTWTSPYLNLHVVVLTGYDDEYFYISDPLRGDVVAMRSSFMNAYEKMGSRAIIATPKAAVAEVAEEAKVAKVGKVGKVGG